MKVLTTDEKKSLAREYNSMSVLTKALPYLTSGGVYVEAIYPKCPCCGRIIDGNFVRVKISEYPNGVSRIDAIGLCCQTATRYLWRVRPEGVFEMYGTGGWYRQALGSKLRWWDLLGRLKQLVRFKGLG